MEETRIVATFETTKTTTFLLAMTKTWMDRVSSCQSDPAPRVENLFLPRCQSWEWGFPNFLGKLKSSGAANWLKKKPSAMKLIPRVNCRFPFPFSSVSSQPLTDLVKRFDLCARVFEWRSIFAMRIHPPNWDSLTKPRNLLENCTATQPHSINHATPIPETAAIRAKCEYKIHTQVYT